MNNASNVYDLAAPPNKERYREYLDSVKRREGALKSGRETWEAHWKDLSRHFLPLKGRFENEQENDGRKNKRGKPLFDSVGVAAAKTLASGMQSGLTPQSVPWFRLAFQQPDLAGLASAAYWLQDVQDRMEQVFTRSNFYGQIGLTYHELGVFGTNVLLTEEDQDAVVRFKALTVGRYWLGADHADRVDTLLYAQNMTARQIAGRFGDWTPETLRTRDAVDSETTYEVMCLIEPRKEYNRLSKRGDQRPWASIFYISALGVQGILEVSGFHEFPALCPRWDITGSDVYGTSPGMIALSDCRMVQSMAEDSVIALRREVRPPLAMPSGLHFPGSGIPDLSRDMVNVYNSSNPVDSSPIVPITAVKANLPGVAEFMEFYRSQIRNNFYVDMFLMLDLTSKNMTATEVNARNAEKMTILGPTLDRMRSELFQAMIDRVFNIMLRAGHLPAPPPEIQGAPLKVEFISTLAQAQQQAKLVPLDNLVQRAASMVEIWPESADLIDIDEYVRAAAAMSGVNPRILRDTEAVERRRQQRAEAQAQAQQQANLANNLALAQSAAQTGQQMAMAEQATNQAGGSEGAMRQ